MDWATGNEEPPAKRLKLPGPVMSPESYEVDTGVEHHATVTDIQRVGIRQDPGPVNDQFIQDTIRDSFERGLCASNKENQAEFEKLAATTGLSIGVVKVGCSRRCWGCKLKLL